MRKIIIFCLIFILFSCADENKRFKFLKSEFKGYKVEPAPYNYSKNGNGPSFLISDSLNNVYAITFWAGSESKIWSIIKIK